jgi:hypothetical protein
MSSGSVPAGESSPRANETGASASALDAALAGGRCRDDTGSGAARRAPGDGSGSAETPAGACSTGNTIGGGGGGGTAADADEARDDAVVKVAAVVGAADACESTESVEAAEAPSGWSGVFAAAAAAVAAGSGIGALGCEHIANAIQSN